MHKFQWTAISGMDEWEILSPNQEDISTQMP